MSTITRVKKFWKIHYNGRNYLIKIPSSQFCPLLWENPLLREPLLRESTVLSGEKSLISENEIFTLQMTRQKKQSLLRRTFRFLDVACHVSLTFRVSESVKWLYDTYKFGVGNPFVSIRILYLEISICSFYSKISLHL